MDLTTFEKIQVLTILDVLEIQSKLQPQWFNITSNQNNELNGIPIPVRKELCEKLFNNGYIGQNGADEYFISDRSGFELRRFLRLERDKDNRQNRKLELDILIQELELPLKKYWWIIPLFTAILGYIVGILTK